jgi:hypothetical protein
MNRRFFKNSLQFCIANWLPEWAGAAEFETVSMFISEVSIQPFNDEGDVCWQESHDPSMVKPSEFGL